MYKSLINHTNKISKGFEPYHNYHKHINDSHYDQMQGNMVIHGKKYCDYIVYSYEDELLYYERIPVNYKHWYNVLYPNAVKLYESKVQPLMIELGIERIDPI